MGHDINICALCDENTVIHNQVKFAKKKQLHAAMSIHNTKIKTANNKLGWNQAYRLVEKKNSCL